MESKIYLFILIDKHTEYILEKGRLRGNPKHIGSIQESPKGKNKKKQTLTSPQLEPNQSKKLIKGKSPTSKQDLDQDQQTNEFFNLESTKPH